MGSSWFGSSWFGSSWFGSSWSGSSGDAGGGTFAMRADQPLAAFKIPLTPAMEAIAKFRDRDWDPDLLALEILPQFLNARINGQSWDQAVTLPAPSQITQQMIDELLILAVTERPEAMGEILQEAQNFQICWLQLLNISRATHPQTFRLMKLAARVGELAMIVLKRRNATRPRPSQICPTLYPPIPVPGHAPYPAGHAIIGQLTSDCLAELVPAHKVALDKLAERCSLNRVIAGLHFREDCEVGKAVAHQLHPFIKACKLYNDTLIAAKKEWE